MPDPPVLGIVELRRYTLVPGQRDALIELFETHLVVPQERVGMHVIGTFRDASDPDAFVWFRGFGDMVDRRRGLEAFYLGPVWKRHRDAANATMLDSDDVLLLRPLDRVVTEGVAGQGPGRLLVTTWTLEQLPDDAALTAWAAANAARVTAVGGTLCASLVTGPAENDFPQLPVREGVHAVTVSCHAAGAGTPLLAAGRELERLVRSVPAQTWLEPTLRSAWRV